MTIKYSQFLPFTCEDPIITPTETLLPIIEALLTILKDPTSISSFLPHSLTLTTAVEALKSILHPPNVEIVQKQRVENRQQWMCTILTYLPNQLQIINQQLYNIFLCHPNQQPIINDHLDQHNQLCSQ